MSTTTREIPKTDWLACLNDLSKKYRGWWVTIEILGHDLGDQRLADGLQLQGLSFEPRGSDAGDILVEVGDLDTAFMIHHVNRARGLWVADAGPGGEVNINVASEDGTTTLVRLRPAGS